MTSTDAQSRNELQWQDKKLGYQDSSSSNVHQGGMPSSESLWEWLNTKE